MQSLFALPCPLLRSIGNSLEEGAAALDHGLDLGRRVKLATGGARG